MKTSKSNLFFILLTIAGFLVLAIVIAYVIFSPTPPESNDEPEPPDNGGSSGPGFPVTGNQEYIGQITNLEMNIKAKNIEIASLNQNLERKDILIADAKTKQGKTEMMLAEAKKSTQKAKDETQANAIKMDKLMKEKMVLIADRDKLMQEKASLVAKLGMFTPENVKKMQDQIGALKKDKKNLEEKIGNLREGNTAKMNEISNLNDKFSVLKDQLANINTPQLTNIDTVNLPNNVKLEMVLIPSGKFTMGSPIPKVGRDFEAQHEVTITKPYYMGKYEVTQEQWEAVMGKNPSAYKGKNLPVTDVSWHDCQEFIKKLNKETGYGFRLPSEREWEYACRAGTKTAFSFGDNITTNDANFGGSGGPVPVGKYFANAFGLYDMHGNVWEWCETEHLVKERVFRGGSFKSDDSKYLRSYHRFWGTEDFRDRTNGGFRLVKTK